MVFSSIFVRTKCHHCQLVTFPLFTIDTYHRVSVLLGHLIHCKYIFGIPCLVLNTIFIRDEPFTFRVLGPWYKFPHFSSKIWKLFVPKFVLLPTSIMSYSFRGVLSAIGISLIFEMFCPLADSVFDFVLYNNERSLVVRRSPLVPSLSALVFPYNVFQNIVLAIFIYMIYRVFKRLRLTDECRRERTTHEYISWVSFVAYSDSVITIGSLDARHYLIYLDIRNDAILIDIIVRKRRMCTICPIILENGHCTNNNRVIMYIKDATI
ncbi:hypothetical protein ATCV1_z783R [Acanthocystis turfacea chlorella virus 1]|uniref:Uncharacterized protein z783R n=1 Tax=Chlorovirus heliozoae TaxID=322019 RepID=A7KA43_9PHYC|nr:hypothetical protein ATCV1_z783R [Acanthocystis turfacea chlorella virus 1]ABT16917.1 hypothetical protein ATCV1_z783R [Acanthocystis turfacea chlorella virus 1]